MTDKQVLAAWLLLGLIAINMFFTGQWEEMWGVISGGGSSASGGSKNLKGPPPPGKMQ